MRLIKYSLAVACTLFCSLPALADEYTITQAEKRFSERKITIAVGDTLSFVNNDGTTHNVHSNTAGHEFDLGAQAPGEATSYFFSNPGTIKVRCAIHPKMKIIVTVE